MIGVSMRVTPIRFTSVPDEIKSYLRSILANEVA